MSAYQIEESERMRTEVTERTLTSAQVEEARGWLEDCFGEDLPADLTDEEITKAVDHHYEGGLDQFVRDAEILVRDYCPMCNEYLPLKYANPAGIVVCKFCATGEMSDYIGCTPNCEPLHTGDIGCER